MRAVVTVVWPQPITEKSALDITQPNIDAPFIGLPLPSSIT